MKSITVAAVFAVLAIVHLSAQAAPASSNGPPKSFRQILQEHHVDLTVPAMLQALRSSAPEIVHVAAAYELAEQPGSSNSIADLADILASENDPNVRVAIAYTLGRLGDGSGVRALDAICLDRSAGSGVRVDAARAKFALDTYVGGRGACRELLFDLLSDDGEERSANEGRTGALGFVPDYVHSGLSRSDLDVLTDMAMKSLRAKDVTERQSAAIAFRFGAFGGQRAISELERALVAEDNEAIRLEIQAALKALRKGSNNASAPNE